MLHDPVRYPNPEVFDPSRHLPGPNGEPEQFDPTKIALGFGRRQAFGLLVLIVTSHIYLQALSWTPFWIEYGMLIFFAFFHN